MSAYHAKKRLGQNFLQSEKIIRKIIDQLEISEIDNIIEIGSGRGALTEYLVESNAAKIYAVEFDKDLIGYLNKLFNSNDNIEIIQADFLSYQPEIDKFKLVGNLPYNITSPVIDWTIKNHSQVQAAVFMIQKEMADRIYSTPGTKNWSPISIFIRLYFEVEKCFDVSPHHFKPVPKVTSSVIKLTPRDKIEVSNQVLFEQVVRESFKQRRKLLVNNLVPNIINTKENAFMLFNRLKLESNTRAEQLTIKQFLKLTELIESSNISI